MLVHRYKRSCKAAEPDVSPVSSTSPETARRPTMVHSPLEGRVITSILWRDIVTFKCRLLIVRRLANSLCPMFCSSCNRWNYCWRLRRRLHAWWASETAIKNNGTNHANQALYILPSLTVNKRVHFAVDEVLTVATISFLGFLSKFIMQVNQTVRWGKRIYYV